MFPNCCLQILRWRKFLYVPTKFDKISTGTTQHHSQEESNLKIESFWTWSSTQYSKRSDVSETRSIFKWNSGHARLNFCTLDSSRLNLQEDSDSRKSRTACESSKSGITDWKAAPPSFICALWRQTPYGGLITQSRNHTKWLNKY
jgi:hypothetical protein